MGDSITQGSSNFTAHRIALESRFNELGWNVEWKGTRADASWGSNNPCEGYSGKNAVEIAAQYESHASAVAADILLLHAGHNYNAGDTNLSPTPMSEEAIIAAVTNAHARIIAAARAQNPDVIVLYAKVITSGGDRAVKYSYIPALNTAIGALADELNTNVSPVICVDMADEWDYATDCVSDCVHPNATGAAKMADKWMAAILPLVAEWLLNVDGANNSWIVTENTVLTSDRTVGALTVNAGVKLDLNGYKLTCSSVNGSGTITSTVKSGDVDVTSPSGTFTMVSPSAYTKGPVSNIFNDNTYYSQGDKDRLLLDLNKSAQKLPLIIDYDFGDGNKKVVNAYKIYAAWRERAPKAWTLYGSNDSSSYNSTTDDGWTAIHSVSGETSWTKSVGKNYESESRSYGCINSTSYRYYRLKITEHVGSNSYFELVQLEYFSTTPGELHLNVASGEEAQWPASITFSGNVKVVKEGAGTLESSDDMNINAPELVIAGGTVKCAKVMRLAQTSGKSVDVTVAEGGTLYSGGILAIGCGGTAATLTVNGGDVYSGGQMRVGNNGSSTATLNLNRGTVEVKNDQACGLPTAGSGVLNLNGGTLKTCRLFCNSAGNGTLNFNGGTLKANARDTNAGGLIHSGVTVNVGENGGTIDSGSLAITVGAAIYGEGAMRFKGGSSVTLSGASNHTGGTTVELGTKLVAANETAKTSILGNLAVDGITYTEDTLNIPVFQYTSDLTDPDDRVHVSFLNCGEGTAAKISGAQIFVDFVAPAWELDADHLTWSGLVAKYGSPASDARVIIKADTDYTLTIDHNVTVGELVFTGSGKATLAVNSGCTLAKTGSGTALWSLDNASTGTISVNAGTLKVKSVTGTGTSQTIRVKRGATFDLNGVSGITVNVILEEGATFVNTGNAISYNADQTVKIILEGDATVKTENDMGLIAPDRNKSELNLGSHILTLKGGNTFRLCNTAVVGSGKIRVTNSGKLTVMASSDGAAGNYSSGGDNYELVMESGSTLTIGNYQSLTVKNFTNNGEITTKHKGTLIVKGILAPGNEIPVLTLADGATIKASATQVQTVSSTFSASGTITIDASEIMKDQLKVAGKTGIPVLTVPAVPSDAKWKVTGVKVDSVRAKWRVNEDGTKTLYIARSDGFKVIVR
ncbi:MAG: hypothetical protein IKL02_08955 [Kiritimatiellae bacterium]|nr:hypothetical protein [Kiritimatiellia bacterium]